MLIDSSTDPRREGGVSALTCSCGLDFRFSRRNKRWPVRRMLLHQLKHPQVSLLQDFLKGHKQKGLKFKPQ